MTIKCLKTLLRNKSIQNLVIYSSILVFGGLYVTWYSSKNQQLHYLTNDGYVPLSFDYYCRSTNNNPNPNVDHIKNDQFLSPDESVLHCSPVTIDKNSNKATSDKLSTSSILANIISSGNIFGNSMNDAQTNDFTNLLSSLLMNGLPLVGLSDYIQLSTFINHHLGEEGKKRLLRYSTCRNKFGNFLDVKAKEIRLVTTGAVSSNITESFFRYLKYTSLNSEYDMKIEQFSTMQDAVYPCVLSNSRDYGKSTCDNIFAVIDMGVSFDHFDADNKPNLSFTIRMNPSTIPDTRDFK